MSGPARLSKNTIQHACLHNKEQYKLQTMDGGKFSHSQRKLKLKIYFIWSLFSPGRPNRQGLTATKASVEMNQSACLLVTSCLQLDSLLGRVGRARDRPGRAPSLLLPPFSLRDPRAKGPLSYHFRWNQGHPPSPRPETILSLYKMHTEHVVPAHHPVPTCLIFMKTDYKTHIYHLSLQPSFKLLKCLS